MRFQWAKKWLLLGVSYMLYMNWNPTFAIVLIGVTVITYLGAILIAELASNKTSKKKVLLWCFCLLGLIPLLCFKYYNFIKDSITSFLELCGLHFSIPGLNWAIPVGISFYTFQAIGYLIDVYMQRYKAERNLADFVLFVSFFPQITSGPISTAKELLPQIKHLHAFNYRQGVDGLKFLLWGMFLKCVVADRLGLYVDTVYANYEHFSGINCFTASIFYTIQIYADFSGYSLMAIGIAKTLGFDLINNFNRPYFATSITEFWKRWHISLTRWLTTYVYIGLGGNRCSKAKQYCNILITFLVSGLWHGANWSFVVWGAIHGLLQIIEKTMGIDPKGKYHQLLNSKRTFSIVRTITTFFLVSFAWIFFRMPSIGEAIGIIHQIFTNHSNQRLFEKMNNSDILFSITAIIILFTVEFRAEYCHNKLSWISNRFVQWIIYVLAFAMILCVGVLDAGSFIYVSF